jgi:hypothetical protein
MDQYEKYARRAGAILVNKSMTKIVLSTALQNIFRNFK